MDVKTLVTIYHLLRTIFFIFQTHFLPFKKISLEPDPAKLCCLCI